MAPKLRILVALATVACGGVQTARPTESLPEPTSPPLPWQANRAQPETIESPLVALVGGTVHTAAGHRYEDGVVVFRDGRLLAVGPASEVQVPEGAETIDVSGRHVTPGIIDTHSHMGVYPVPRARAHADGNEATGAVTANVWSLDSVWPQDPALQRALAAGITTIHVLPGSANLVGGRGVTLKLGRSRTTSGMRFPGAPDTLKMACGENPKRVYGARNQAPSTRMGNVAGYRAAFQKAAEYGRSWGEWQHKHRLWQRKRMRYEQTLDDEGRPRPPADGEDAVEDPGPEPSPPDRDFGLEALWGVLQGEVLVQMHCYRADEMARMLEIADEFGFRIHAFHHAVEAYKIRDLLAEAGTGVSTWADWWGFKLEAYDAVIENLALLQEAGVRGALHSDSNMLVQRLPQEVAKAMWAGRHAGIDVSRNDALRWITANAAWQLGVEEQTGTLEVGKMADVVVWSGDPFSVYTHADLVYVDGQLRFDRSQPPTRSDFELGQEVYR